MKKNNVEKKAPGREKTPPEKYWKEMTQTYFVFYSRRFKDESGYPLSPRWTEATRGMESSALKKIITRLREIAEQKNIEWTCEAAIIHLHNFLQKAYNIEFIKKSMLCCMMNKFADMIISSEYSPTLVVRVMEAWYHLFPDYTKDEERDKTASQIIIGFLKQQYLQNNLEFTDTSVMQSVRIIFHHITQDEFWSKKTLRSVANNLQEFITKIKSKNGPTKTFTREGVNEEFNRRLNDGRYARYNQGGQDGNKP